MRRIFSLLAIFFVFAEVAFAQIGKLEPGIYAVVDSTSTHLSFTRALTSKSGFSAIGFEMGKQKFKYKGETSGVRVTDKIIMVVDPEKKVIKRTLKKYDPFVSTMTPELIIIVPLEVAKKQRIYNEGTNIMGVNVNKGQRMDFQWELVDENTFIITADLKPGEYAVVFKPAKMGSFDFTGIYGFYVSEQPEISTPEQ